MMTNELRMGKDIEGSGRSLIETLAPGIYLEKLGEITKT
jgi:hypothetical protein